MHMRVVRACEQKASFDPQALLRPTHSAEMASAGSSQSSAGSSQSPATSSQNPAGSSHSRAGSSQDRVPLTRSWTYRMENQMNQWTLSMTGGSAVGYWTLWLEDGEWWYYFHDELVWRRVDTSDWREGKFYYIKKQKRWGSLRTHRNSSQILQWEALATQLLPYMNSILASDTYRFRDFKDWSNLGETHRYGDVSNRVMALAVQMAMEVYRRSRHRGIGLWEIERRNSEHRADVLEAVMGFRVTQPTTFWVNWGDLVDDICCDVYEAWETPELRNHWDPRVVIPVMRELFGIDDLFEYWEQKARREERIWFGHRQLILRLCLPEPLVAKVLHFLY